MIRDGVLQRGYKWTAIAKSLPHKRSADAVRNRWQRLQSRRRGGTPRGSTALMRPRSDGEADSEGGASAEGSGDGADVGGGAGACSDAEVVLLIPHILNHIPCVGERWPLSL